MPESVRAGGWLGLVVIGLASHAVLVSLFVSYQARVVIYTHTRDMIIHMMSDSFLH